MIPVIDRRSVDVGLASMRAVTLGVERATIRATNKAARFGSKELIRDVAGASGLKQRVLKDRVFNRFARASQMDASIWLGTFPVRAAYVGRLQNLPSHRGAKAGDFYFEGGFIARLSSGHRSIFKRVRRSRLPIEEQSVKVQDINVDAVADRTNERLDVLLDQELNFELNVKPGRNI